MLLKYIFLVDAKLALETTSFMRCILSYLFFLCIIPQMFVNNFHFFCKSMFEFFEECSLAHVNSGSTIFDFCLWEMLKGELRSSMGCAHKLCPFGSNKSHQDRAEKAQIGK